MYLYMYSIKIIISIHIIISSNSISKYVNSRIISNHVINSRVYTSIHIIQQWRVRCGPGLMDTLVHLLLAREFTLGISQLYARQR